MRFGDFSLDLDARQLHRGADERHLSPKAFDLLALLVAQRPRVVEKDTLRDHLWPGTNVVEANLNNLASELRAALDDDPQHPRFVRTVHRVGYAFCAEVTEDRAAPVGALRAKARLWLAWRDRTFALDQPVLTIGRDPTCQIWIDAPGVSRRHAIVRLTGEGTRATAVIEDLDSTNGTFVSGRRVRQPMPLEDGQAIRLGEATLTVRSTSAADVPTKKIKRPK